jgi:hypothetical protein
LDVTLVTLAVGDSATSVPDLVVKYQLAADGFPLSNGMETIPEGPRPRRCKAGYGEGLPSQIASVLPNGKALQRTGD